MASFKEVRLLLLDSYLDGVIDEDEFVLLNDMNRSKNPEFPHQSYERFDLDSMDPSDRVQSLVSL
jgi:hypothetical protein